MLKTYETTSTYVFINNLEQFNRSSQQVLSTWLSGLSKRAPLGVAATVGERGAPLSTELTDSFALSISLVMTHIWNIVEADLDVSGEHLASLARELAPSAAAASSVDSMIRDAANEARERTDLSVLENAFLFLQRYTSVLSLLGDAEAAVKEIRDLPLDQRLSRRAWIERRLLEAQDIIHAELRSVSKKAPVSLRRFSEEIAESASVSQTNIFRRLVETGEISADDLFGLAMGKLEKRYGAARGTIETMLHEMDWLKYHELEMTPWVRIACVQLAVAIDTALLREFGNGAEEHGLYTKWVSEGLIGHKHKIERALQIIDTNGGCDVIVFPELSGAESVQKLLQAYALKHETIVIAGTYYRSATRDDVRINESVAPIIIADKIYTSKEKPSRL